MISQAAFNALCAALPQATHVVQWGGSDVWKVGGKLFAIGDFSGARLAGITFKVTPLAFEALGDAPGLRPAPYLASRGMKWIQHYGEPGLDQIGLADHLRISHYLVVQALPKRTRSALGLEKLTI